ncbi:DUF262 domain-containing protein [Ancrocorticia populi]|uniref:DUF262 domain-containing protein n=1 Tax=Ancrocorticia populi TaxID=2175228 RepID=A0A2V1K8K5_9ACTO|nr:DUF262 domain-containing protein [Ancrocorticia populi]PWF26536.1 hypothetical protein DD236_06710 [Ancrocorticia populi]
MAENTEFDHDQLGHLLADHLVEVPEFQRAYSWERVNVREYLADLARARKSETPYFMGTIVFAKTNEGNGRRKVVDGQQRLATTAVLIAAIRDRLQELGKASLSDNISKKYLRRFSIRDEGEVDSLILSPNDQDAYDAIIACELSDVQPSNRIRICYEECRTHLSSLAPTVHSYRRLVDIIDQLENDVQVLVAVASDLPEAYVIFETLNDRGADLTTADLLKNFLFSEARPSDFRYVEQGWNSIETNLGNKPDAMVKFVRHDFMSRNGKVTARKLYRALQDELRENPGAKRFVQRLKKAQVVYLALSDSDNEYWREVSIDVRDALIAYRRFGFESSYPVLLAAFREWEKEKASRLLVKIAKWSVRAQFAGRIGAGASEEAFAAAAAAISDGRVTNQQGVREILSKLIPTDAEFRLAFTAYGKLPTNRAKYVLAMLEKAADAKTQQPERPLDWTSTGVTIEHIMPQSKGQNEEATDFKIREIGNLTLLEKRLNHQLSSRPYSEKRSVYGESSYSLTQALAAIDSWDIECIGRRTEFLADLACLAWPAD